MSTHKRGGSFNHYGDRSQHYSKKPRPTQPSYSSLPNTSSHHHDQSRNGHGKPPQRGPAPPPQPALSATEMQTGLVALLDRFVAAETTSDGDKSILHHATELRRLVSRRTGSNPSVQARRELDVKRPDNVPNVAVPDYIYRKVNESQSFPPLPPISEPHLHEAVFTHRTFHDASGQLGAHIDLALDYERLEFLGDAYIELIASRALYNRFPQVDVPQLCSWRERLVENSALGKFSEAYGFPDRLKRNAHWDKDSKSWKKIVADIFEAYVAALVLSDPEDGFTIAENWLDELWAPQLLGFKEKIIENPRARDDLQKLVFVNDIKLDFRQEKPMSYDSNNLQVYSMGVYLTGWGYNDEWLGSGQGQNKVQACVAAATDALKNNNPVLQDATKKKAALLEARRIAKEEKAKADAEAKEEENGTAADESRPAESSKVAKEDKAEDTGDSKKRKSEVDQASPQKSKKKHRKEKEKRKPSSNDDSS